MAQETTNQGQNTSSEQRRVVDERWDEIRSALKTQWSVLSDNDLNMIDGDSRKLVALVHQKTNQPIHEIEEAIDQIAAKSNGLLSRLLRTTSEMADSATRQVTEPIGRVAQQTRQVIVERPLPSIGAVFGAGFLLGLLAYRLTFEE